MQLLDYAVIVSYFILVFVIGLAVSRRGSASTEDYFLSGRKLPWWLAGLSMVATTFAADTPLVVTGLIAKDGIAGNWVWWNMAISALLTTFFYAKLWRLSGVTTDAEFASIRYAGKAAEFLRVFRAWYLAVPFNILVMGWVTLGMTKVLEAAFGWDAWIAIAGIYTVTLAYMALSGLWGVVLTDAIQFTLAMAGSIVLAVFAVEHVGGMDSLKSQLFSLGYNNSLFEFFPQSGSDLFTAFLVFVGVQWWATSYPGAEPGGGGYIAQRFFSARNENHAFGASLFFNIAHYALRPWPWIITALVSLVVFPGLADPEQGYPLLMKKLMPPGLLGLMGVLFLAAFMSTISTHLNWGASYLINDVFRKKLQNTSDKKRVAISRLSVVFLGLLAIVISRFFDRVQEIWEFLLMLGAGAGPVFLLRWFWWRINAVSEITAMAASFVVSLSIKFIGGFNFAEGLIITAASTTVAWLAATFISAPEKPEVLRGFCERVQPGGFWGEYQSTQIMKARKKEFYKLGMYWLGSCLLLYGVMFLTGKLLLG